MLYLRHIVEQPINRLYCSLLISLVSRSQTLFLLHLIWTFSRTNVKEKRPAWLRETTHFVKDEGAHNICYSFLCINV